MAISRDGDGYFNIYDLARELGGTLIRFGRFSIPDTRVDKIIIDSRQVSCHDVFAAYSGSNTNGEKYASEAFERGCVAVLCTRGGAVRMGIKGIYIEVDDLTESIKLLAYAVRRGCGAKVVGITGSVGKTTVRQLCFCMLHQRYFTDTAQGNFNNALGLSLSVINAFGAEAVCHKRGKYRENAPKYLVLELGISLRGEMEALVNIAAPDISIITNVGIMHAETLGGREGVAYEKAKIAVGCKAVVCGDDPILLKALSSNVDMRNVTVLQFNSEIQGKGNGAEKTVLEAGGKAILRKCHRGDELYGSVDVTICEGDGESREYLGITTPIVGDHGLVDTALAVVLGDLCGLSDEDMRLGAAEYTPVGMRQRIERAGGIIRIVDCYNSGPDSVRAALSAMMEYSRFYRCKRRVAVLGSMLELGDLCRSEHYKLGRELSDYGIDLLFTVGNEAEEIARGAIDGGMSSEKVHIFSESDDREKIKSIIALKTADKDIILYKASRGIRLEELL